MHERVCVFYKVHKQKMNNDKEGPEQKRLSKTNNKSRGFYSSGLLVWVPFTFGDSRA